MARKLLIMTSGTRGDVQPFVPLARALIDAGFNVLVTTGQNLEGFLQSFGINAVGVATDLKQFFCENSDMRKCIETGDIMKMGPLMLEKNLKDLPAQVAKYKAIVENFKPDVLLVSTVEQCIGKAMGRFFKIPVIDCWLQHAFPTGEDTSMIGEPEWFSQAMHQAAWLLFWKVTRDHHVNSMHPALTLHLPGVDSMLPTSLRQYMLDLMHPVGMNLIGFSPSLFKRPSDWPDDLQPIFTGFWTLGQEEQTQQMQQGSPEFGGNSMQQLTQFLSEGDKPVYMGWGSMLAADGKTMAALAARTLKQAGCRGVISAGWAGLQMEFLKDLEDSEELLLFASRNICFTDTAPHEWLFPQCAATVHHGGAGTTATALRSGVPTIITPCFFDQFSNAKMVEKTGAGIVMPQFSKTTPRMLADAIHRVLEEPEFRSNCAKISQHLKSENSLKTAVEAVQRFIRDEVDTGQYARKTEKRIKQLKRLKEYERGVCSSFASPAYWMRRCGFGICSQPLYFKNGVVEDDAHGEDSATEP